MLPNSLCKPLIACGCLFLLLACSKGEPDSAAAPAVPDVVAENTTIFEPAVPEFPELSWKLIREFNLPLNNPPHVRPATA